MQGREEKGKESHEEYRVQICFPCVCFNHSSLYLVCIVAYLRRWIAKRKKTPWVLGRAALLPDCIFVFLSFFFFFSLPLSFQDKDVTPQTGTTKTARNPPPKKKTPLCSQPAEVVINGTLNKKNRERKAHFLPSCERQTPLLWWKISLNWLCLSVVCRREFPEVENSGMCYGSKCSIYCFKQGGVITRHTSHSLPLWCHRATETQSRCLFSNNRHFSSSDNHSHWAVLMALCCLHLFA